MFHSGSNLESSNIALTTAKFLAVDVDVYEQWRASIQDTHVRESLSVSNDFGFCLPLIEKQLLGETVTAWSWVAAISTESEDEQEELFTSIFVVKILESLNLLTDDDGSLSKKSLNALGVIAKENFVDSDRLASLVTQYFI